jgi:transposase
LQVVIALVITTDGFPLAYEVMDGNASDRTTTARFSRPHREDLGKKQSHEIEVQTVR